MKKNKKGIYLLLAIMTLSFSTGAAFAQDPLRSLNDARPSGTSRNEDSDAVYIKEIEFSGNKLINSSDIMKKIKMQSGDPYSRDLVQQNLKYIYDMGYFSDKIKAVPVVNPDKTITLRITVEENVPIRAFTIEGNNSVSISEINEILHPLVSEPQNIVVMNQAVERIEELYAQKGYILARVCAVEDDPDGVVNLNIEEGKIKSMNIQGNNKTKDFVITRNVLTEPGEVYNENLLKQDLMRLYGTQAFKDVTRTIERDECESDKYNITINVEEQRTATISVGGGVDTSTGLFGSAGISENNFRGRGQKVSANFLGGSGVIISDSSTLNRANWQAEVSFFEPSLKGRDNSLLVKGFFRDFASYQIPLSTERRFGLDTVVSRQLKTYKNLMGSLGFSMERISVKEGDLTQITSLYNAHNIDISQRAKQLEGGTFATLSPSLIYDSRDNAMNPRTGTLASLRLDQAVGLSRLDSTHAKLAAGIKQYIPIPGTKKAAISLSARAAGKLYGEMPEVLAYRLGGPYTVRGYRMSGVGTGQGFAMGSAELLLPLPFGDKSEKLRFLDNIRVSLFTDAGQIFKENISDKIYNRPLNAITAGIGLKVFIPGMGPLSVDYGLPLTHRGKSGSGGVFTFGAGDMFY